LDFLDSLNEVKFNFYSVILRTRWVRYASKASLLDEGEQKLAMAVSPAPLKVLKPTKQKYEENPLDASGAWRFPSMPL
jgi:hypothetical protein